MNEIVIYVCCSTGCNVSGAGKVYGKFTEMASSPVTGMKVKRTGCHGFCERGPLVVVKTGNKEIFYQQVAPENVEEIVNKTVLKGEIIENLLYTDPVSRQKIANELDVPFYKYQKRQIFACNGKIDPEDIDDYIANDGYSALKKALKLEPDAIIDEIKKAG